MWYNDRCILHVCGTPGYSLVVQLVYYVVVVVVDRLYVYM